MLQPLRRVGFLRTVLALCAVAALAGAARAEEPAAAKPNELRVLFLGNSQIFYNNLPRIVEVLSESAPAERPRIKTGRSVAGGASLESLWNAGEGAGKPRAMIAGEKWDYVVIQEIYTYYDKPEKFNQYAKLFDELIRRHGSRTVLYCTASVNSLYPQGFVGLHDMHVALGKQLLVPVAAGGQSWLQYWGENPTLEARLALYNADKAHPGIKGSYINACALYAVLTGESPVGLTNRIPDQPEDAVTPEEAQRFQEAAWKVHQAINAPVAKP